MNLSPMEPYKYQPLDPGYIRILSLTSPTSPQSGAGDYQLTFSLTTILLSKTSDVQHEEYDALSYVWGDPTDETFPLICDGKIIQIQPNLHTALPYLMRRPSNRPIWIDAVCINQKDEVEKLVQIKKMSDVYKKATQVWIWLNAVPKEELEAAKEAVNCISRIGQAGFSKEQLQEGTFTTNQLSLPPVESPAWKVIVSMLEAPWFTRLWIIQEFTVAKSALFLFGDHTISSHNLKATKDALLVPRHLLDDDGHELAVKLYNCGFSAMPFACRDQYLNHTIDSFHAAGIFVFMTMAQKCYNPKDRVFGLLGLFEPEELSRFKCDAETSLPELYAGFVWFILSSRTYPMTWRYMLWFAIDTVKYDSEFPSWCPDFLRLHQMKRLEVSSTGVFGVHRASNSQISTMIGQTPMEIMLKGCVFDTVQMVGQRMSDLFNITTADNCKWWMAAQDWEKQVAEMISEIAQPEASQPRGLSNLTALLGGSNWTMSKTEYFQFLFQHASKNVTNPIQLNEFLHLKGLLNEAASIVQKFDLNKCIEYLEKPDNYQGDNTDLIRLRTIFKMLESDSGKQLRLALESHRCRRPFVTAKSRVGLLFGNEVAPGDLVCLFDGLPVYHIIRKRENNLNSMTYRLIGEAVIYKHMNGELQWQGFQDPKLLARQYITLS